MQRLEQHRPPRERNVYTGNRSGLRPRFLDRMPAAARRKPASAEFGAPMHLGGKRAAWQEQPDGALSPSTRLSAPFCTAQPEHVLLCVSTSHCPSAQALTLTRTTTSSKTMGTTSTGARVATATVTAILAPQSAQGSGVVVCEAPVGPGATPTHSTSLVKSRRR
jgi:hypothetical protein